MGKAEDKKSPRVYSWGTFLAVLAILITLLALWLGAEGKIDEKQKEILDLQGENNILRIKLAKFEKNVEALEMALDQNLPTDTNEWVKYHNEYPIQFYVTDHLEQGLGSTTVLVVRSGEEVVTNDNGLTSTLWVELGDQVTLNKNGFQSEKVVFDRENIETRVISIKLRRMENAKEKVER